MTAGRSGTPDEGQRHPYLILALVAFGIFIAADDLTVISTMLPQMIVDFEIPLPSGLDDASWIVTGYLITHVVAMPLLGRVSDLHGRRRIFVACLAIFAVGSLLVAQARDLSFLITARVIQAVGGGGIVPVGLAIVGDVVPLRRRAVALGALGAVDTLGWIVGPLYGAFWVRYFSWQWQFYINLPISLLGIAAAWYLLRDLGVPHSDKPRSLDWPGALLLSLTLLLFNLGLARIGAPAVGPTFDFSGAPEPLPPWQIAAPFFLGAALTAVAFVWLERRVAQPLIDLGLFRSRNLSLACLISGVVGFGSVIAMVAVPLFVNTVLAEGADVSDMLRSAAVGSGQLLSAFTVAMATLSVVGGWLTSRLGYRPPAALGLILLSGGFLLMSSWSPAIERLQMILHLAVAGFGLGLVLAPVATAVIDAVPAASRGMGTGLLLMFRLMGMSVGLSGLAAWGLIRFRELGATFSVAEMIAQVPAITAQVLGETFLGASLLALAGLGLALFLRREIRLVQQDGASAG
ncbi:MAG: MFS transporter [Anaerolineae bacterium]